MIRQQKQYVTIKGTKDGLVFQLDDRCAYDQLLSELQEKLSSTHYNDIKGRMTDVIIDSGFRYLQDSQKEELTKIITTGRHLTIKAFQSRVLSNEEAEKKRKRSQMVTLHRMIRSGQVVTVDGDVMLIGDVNPGGTIRATGNIYVLGALRGIAHAGYAGDELAVVAASYMSPVQIKIAEYIRYFENEGEDDCFMATAFIDEHISIHIGHIHELMHIRPHLAKADDKKT